MGGGVGSGVNDGGPQEGRPKDMRAAQGAAGFCGMILSGNGQTVHCRLLKPRPSPYPHTLCWNGGPASAVWQWLFRCPQRHLGNASGRDCFSTNPAETLE